MALGYIAKRENTAHTARSIISMPVTAEASKKDKKINIRIPEDLWLTFSEDCAARGTTASAEIRRLIEQRLT